MVHKRDLLDRLNERIIDVFPTVEYRLMQDAEDRHAMYRLRYDAYRREDRIAENPQRLSFDDLDTRPNTLNFGIYIGGRLGASLRLSIVSSACRHSVSMFSNPDLLNRKLDAGLTFVDPSRFVIAPEMVAEFPELPYLTMRLPVMACLHFDVDECFTLARQEHHSFYARVFRSRPIAEPVYLEMLNMDVQLLSCCCEGMFADLDSRFPFFRSNAIERRALFGRREDMIGFEALPLRSIAQAA